ncbi:F-box/LRR-repeat protein 15 isoform X2 [Cryptomeria japonica]|uniref:F-box/LRR-repeat protein 15 isoform X2 n=1 Tax=Cryptomeria japonica TaxID=3369 RepID=UPI0027D9F627|nr:F-box/LRR-repeat protein 15 isoform X2 [Cryptomeria japonica]
MANGRSFGTMWGLNKCAGGEEPASSSRRAESVRLGPGAGASDESRATESGVGLPSRDALIEGEFFDFDEQLSSGGRQTLEGLWDCAGPSIGLSVNSTDLNSANSNSPILRSANSTNTNLVNLNSAYSNSANLISDNFGLYSQGRAESTFRGKFLRDEAEQDRCLNEASMSSGIVRSFQLEVCNSHEVRAEGSLERRILREEVEQHGCCNDASSSRGFVKSLQLDVSHGARAEGSFDGGILREEVEQDRCLNGASSSSAVDSLRHLDFGITCQQFDPARHSDRSLQGISPFHCSPPPPEFQFFPISEWEGGSDDDEMLYLPDSIQAKEDSHLEHSKEIERGSSISGPHSLCEHIPFSSMFAMPHINDPAIIQHKRAKVLGNSLSDYFAATFPSEAAGPSSSSVTQLDLSLIFSNGGGSSLTSNDVHGEPMDSVSGGDDDNDHERCLDQREDLEVRMDLTDDLLHMVFSFLDHSNLCKAAMVCKQWRAASTHEDFWKSLNFENCKITIEQVTQMCRRYSKAVELNVRGTPFVDELLCEAMYSLRNLEVLVLGRGPLSERFFTGLVDCPVLHQLSISEASLGNSSQDIQVQHESLRHLQMIRCRVIRISIRCPQLETLSLKRSGMASAILTCPQLRELDVASCHKLSDAGVRIAATSCPLLTSLDMSNCSYVSDETLREIAAACSNLHILDASYCPNISLEAVRMPMLTDMKLHSCEGINASSMVSLSHCFMLEALQLDFCWLLTSVTLDLPRLQTISLINCRKFVELNLRSPVLSSINVSNCPILNRIDITSSALQKLVLQKQQSLTAISLQCIQLCEVDLTECESLTNSICKVFSEKGGCPKLNSLILDGCESLTEVQLNSTSLNTLSLVGCRAMTNLELACPNLQQVVLDGCDHLQEALLRPVGLHSLNLGICPRLSKLEMEAPLMTVLELKGCGVLSQVSINCPQLLSLDASFCSQLQDDCVFATTSLCPKIELLILMSCPSIGTKGLSALKLLSNLSLLDLSYTFLTNLQPVFETCSRLKVLKLQACKYLMNTSLDALHRGQALPGLRELDLSYSSLCQSAIEKLLAWCPHLTHVSLNGCANMYDLDWGLEAARLYNCTSIDNAVSVHTGQTSTDELESSSDWMDDERIQDRLLENLNCVGCPNIKKVTIPASACCLHLSSLNLSLSANLKEVALGCCNLISLNLSNCLALEVLKLDCPRLISLFLQGCGIEEEEVESAIRSSNSLETLDIRFCPKISLTGISKLRMISPGLKRLFSSVSV